MEVKKVKSFSKEARSYYRIIGNTHEFDLGIFTNFAFKFLASLPTTSVYVFMTSSGEVVGGMIFSHFSVNVLFLRNLISFSRLQTFFRLYLQGYKYGSFLVVDKKYRGEGYVNLMWSIPEKYYLYLLNTSKEEKILKNGGKKVLKKDGAFLPVGGVSKSLYYSIEVSLLQYR